MWAVLIYDGPCQTGWLNGLPGGLSAGCADVENLRLPLDHNETILLHLGMSGSIRIHQAEPPIGKHDHIILAMSGPQPDTGSDKRLDPAPQHWITFNDPRRFGWLDLFSGETHPMLADMGPEPLGNSFTAAYLSAAVDRRTGPIKTALLNQTLVAGIGNICV